MKTKWVTVCVVLLLTTLAAGAVMVDGSSRAKPASTDAVDPSAIVALERRDEEAAKINDVEALLSLWTEDGVLLLPRQKALVGNRGDPAGTGAAAAAKHPTQHPSP